MATNVTTSDYGGCASVTLLDPQGDAFARSWNCSGGSFSLSIGPDTLNGTGTWSVLLQTDTTATGSADIVVTTPASVGTVSVNGASTALDVGYPGQQPELTFAGTRTGKALTSWRRT